MAARDLEKALSALPPDPERRVKAALAFRGETAIAMASALRINQGLLSNALKGHRKLSADQLNAIAEYLDVPRPILFPAAA